MSTISEQPKGCDVDTEQPKGCEVYPYQLTHKMCVKCQAGMDVSHKSCNDDGSCDDCLWLCCPCTFTIDTAFCPVTTTWLAFEALLKWCKGKKQSSENVVVNA